MDQDARGNGAERLQLRTVMRINQKDTWVGHKTQWATPTPARPSDKDRAHSGRGLAPHLKYPPGGTSHAKTLIILVALFNLSITNKQKMKKVKGTRDCASSTCPKQKDKVISSITATTPESTEMGM